MTGLPIARIAGLEIRAPLGWVIVIAILAALVDLQLGDTDPSVPDAVGWLVGGAVGLGFFLGAAAHDLAHALVARRRGIAVSVVTVTFFGGTSSTEVAGRTPGEELAIAAAGPLASLALGLATAAGAVVASLSTGLVASAVAPGLATLSLLLLFVGIVNLVPAYPLDGGRLVRAVVWKRRGSATAGLLAAARTGRLIGIAAIVSGVPIAVTGDATNGMVVALTGWLLILTARTIADQTAIGLALGGLRVRDVMDGDVPVASPSLALDTFAAQFLSADGPPIAFPVIGAGALVGVIGPAQLRRVRTASWPGLRVESTMVPIARIRVAAPDESVAPAFERMRRAGLEGLPVLGPEGYLGMLSIAGIRRATRTPRDVTAEAERS